MVAKAQLIPALTSNDDSQGGMSKVGKVFLFLFLLAGAAVGVVLFQKRIKTILSKEMLSTVASQTRRRLLLRVRKPGVYEQKQQQQQNTLITKPTEESTFGESESASGDDEDLEKKNQEIPEII
jgi:hypothetical protein